MISTSLPYAARRLLVDFHLTATAVLTLSLGLGAAVVIVDTLDRLLIRPPIGVADPDRVTRIYIDSGSGLRTTTDNSTVEGLERELAGEFEHVAAYFIESLSLGRGEQAEQVQVAAHGSRYFDALGVEPQLGSLVASTLGEEFTAVISYGLWQRRFGGTPDVIGQPLRLGSDVYTIDAVLSPGFAGVDFTAVDVWLPLSVRASKAYGATWEDLLAPFLNVVARLRPDVDRDAAGAHATAVYRAVHELPPFQSHRVILGDLARSPEMSETTRVALWLGAISLVVLLIACINVANMLYVRGMRRKRETSLRVALGASRGRLMRDIVVDAALLSAAAGVVAFAMVVTTGTVVRRLFLPTAAAVVSPLDIRLILLTVGGCLATTLLLGLLPAVRLTTKRMVAPTEGMRPASPLLDLFTGAQIALSVPLLVGAGLFVLSLMNAIDQNLGFDASRVVAVRTNLFEVGEGNRNAAAHRTMQMELAALSQVEASAVVQQEPWRGAQAGITFSVAGRERPTFVPVNGVDSGFFDVMRLPVVEGRLFSEAENRGDAPPVAVVSEALASAIWAGESPVGECLVIDADRESSARCTQVIGVVADARWSPLIRPTGSHDPIAFVPLEQYPNITSARAVLIRVAGDPRALMPLLRQRVRIAGGSRLPYVDVRTFDETFQPLLRPWRLGAAVFVVFGLLALGIAAVGVIVVTADGVARQTRDLAVRAACGAEPGKLVRLVLVRSLRAMIGGLCVGLAVAAAGAYMLRALLFDVAPADFRIFSAAAAILLACGLLAAWLPARHAGRVDPAVALRAE